MGGSKKRHNARKKPQQKKSKKQNKPTTNSNPPPSIPQTSALPVESEGGCGVIGLTNLGNTCYFNSVLQLLMSSTHFREYLGTLDRTGLHSSTPLTSAMLEILSISKLQSSKKTTFKPNRALGVIRSDQPMFKGKAQHDAHELLMVLLQILVEEEDQTAITQPDQRLSKALFGQLTSLITCLKCGYTKSEEEDFMVVSASIVKEEEKNDGLMSHTIDLPDVIEHSPPQTHEAKSDESPLRNNLIEDSGPQGGAITQMEAEDDDSFPFVPEWFDIKDEFESSGVLSESECTETANNDTTWHQKSKGKKKKKKGNHQYQQYEPWIEIEDEVETTMQLKDLESCLERFFASERVTWRCAIEFPEKRVSFSEDDPEVFVLPTHERRISFSSFMTFDPSLPLDEEGSSGEVQDSSEQAGLGLRRTQSGLRSCLKKEAKSAKSPTPAMNSTKQYRICKKPKVLCIHLKRFESGRRRRVGKLTHPVRFDLELNISKFLNLKDSSEANYELKAVVCHSGSLNFGHYTCFVSRWIGGRCQWYDVSDSEITKVSESAVLKSQAYILLYEIIMEEQSSPESPSESNLQSQS